jgi:hypothetical protein
MTWAWFNHPVLERARAFSWALADRAAFIVESFAVAIALFWALTWAACSFDWQTSTHEWGSFWTHYAKASGSARAPVEHFVIIALLVLTAATAAVRYPKARLCWAPWRLGAGNNTSQEQGA